MYLVQKKNICYLCCRFLETNDSSNFELKTIQGCLHDTLNSHPNDINLKFSSSIVSLILMTKRKEGKASNTQQWYMLFSLDDTLVACSRGELRFLTAKQPFFQDSSRT